MDTQLPETKWRTLETGPKAESKTIFEACRNAAWESEPDGFGNVASAVIQAIIDRTPSPATVVELTRILREGGVEVPEVTFD